jgi:histidinol phosphatase-like PHP family hydrolase
MGKVLGRHDLHTHTLYSDGQNTISDNIRAAVSNGLDTVAITDHCFDSDDAEWLPSLVAEIKDIKAPINILAGVEGTILDTRGTLSVDEAIAGKLDIVLVDLGKLTQGVYTNAPCDPGKLCRNIADAYIYACGNPLVNIIAHPFNVGRLQANICIDDFPDNLLMQVADAFVAGGKAFEIMNMMSWWFPSMPVKELTRSYLRVVRIFAERGVIFALGSDAHSACGVGNLGWANQIVEKVNLHNQLIERITYK